ncbi:hypothetical protein DW262_13610 [Segatella copri]|jgi:hypothetical protein|uniref:Uncharacterized protein n=1 Tax=Segatella copri TaxID=165179 RepID=A0A3R6E1U8_9BACT|nr:hypothetical protein DW263_14480 [Segatella copri]RHG32331.1 hypothetical protein DW262_13610 [Segatella copri]RHG62759.1 hypothetical protein DW250_13805 [Segatella copri]
MICLFCLYYFTFRFKIQSIHQIVFFLSAKVVNISFDCSKNSEKLHANLYAPLRFYTLIIYRTAQAQNKEVGIFPHPFRGNPDRGSKKHRIFAPEKET